jgi:hypothetical protein
VICTQSKLALFRDGNPDEVISKFQFLWLMEPANTKHIKIHIYLKADNQAAHVSDLYNWVKGCERYQLCPVLSPRPRSRKAVLPFK